MVEVLLLDDLGVAPLADGYRRDPLVHNFYEINLTGKAMRKREKLTQPRTDE